MVSWIHDFSRYITHLNRIFRILTYFAKKFLGYQFSNVRNIFIRTIQLNRGLDKDFESVDRVKGIFKKWLVQKTGSKLKKSQAAKTHLGALNYKYDVLG